MAKSVPAKQSISHCSLRAFLCAKGACCSSFVRAFAHPFEELSATPFNERAHSPLKYEQTFRHVCCFFLNHLETFEGSLQNYLAAMRNRSSEQKVEGDDHAKR